MSTQNELLSYITKELAPGHPQLEADASLAGIIDSTAVMELVVWIEGKYDIQVEVDDITPENFGSARALAEYIERSRA